MLPIIMGSILALNTRTSVIVPYTYRMPPLAQASGKLGICLRAKPVQDQRFPKLMQGDRIKLLTHFWRPIQNVILLWYYTIFTWIKISRARQLVMEEKQTHILKGFSLHFLF